MLTLLGEELVEHERVNRSRIPMSRKRLKMTHKALFGLRLCLERSPLHVEPLAEKLAFLGCFRGLDQAERVARCGAQPLGTECERAQDDLLGLMLCVTQHHGRLRDRADGTSDLDLGHQPFGEALSQPPRPQLVSGGAIVVTPQAG
jgi:hypothetical protein